MVRLADSELTVSEGLCTERCIKKYTEVGAALDRSTGMLILCSQVHTRVGKVLQGLQQQQEQQQQAMAQARPQ